MCACASDCVHGLTRLCVLACVYHNMLSSGDRQSAVETSSPWGCEGPVDGKGINPI